MHPGLVVLLVTLLIGFVLIVVIEWREIVHFVNRSTLLIVSSTSICWLVGVVGGLTALAYPTTLSVVILGSITSAAFGFLLGLAGWQLYRNRRLYISRVIAVLAAIPLALGLWIITQAQIY